MRVFTIFLTFLVRNEYIYKNATDGKRVIIILVRGFQRNSLFGSAVGAIGLLVTYSGFYDR